MSMRLNRVIVFVADTLRCAAFYRDMLGLKAAGEWTSEWAALDSGGCELAFHQARSAAGKQTRATGSPMNPHKIVFYAKNVAATRTKLLARGVKMGTVQRFKDGRRTVAFCDGHDPEGHRFQISSR